MKSSCVYRSRIATEWGDFEIEVTERGIARLSLPRRKKGCRSRKDVPEKIKKMQSLAHRALRSYLSGTPNCLGEVPLDCGEMTPFTRRVFSSLSRVPPGKTITYGGLAKMMGCPGAARAVGSAMRKNRIPILRPCHRVVPSTGGPGRYSGGAGWKERLLRLEAGMGTGA